MTNNFLKKATKALFLVLVCLSVFVACDKDNADLSLSSEHAATNAAINYENADALFDRFYKANGALEKTREYAKDVYLNSVANGFHVLKESGKEELYEENVRAFNEDMEEFVSLGKEGQSFFYLFTDERGAAELAASGLPHQTLLSLQMEEKKQLMRENQLEISPFEEEEETENAFFNKQYNLPYPSNDVFFEVDEEKAHQALHVPKARKYTITIGKMKAMDMCFNWAKSTAKGLGHMGVATGNNNKIMDANRRPEIGQNGMKIHNYTPWTTAYPINNIAKTSSKVSSYAISRAKFEMIDLYNTHPTYSLYAPKKRRPSTVYCSLVPWIAFKYGANINVDYTGASGYWVTPMDVYTWYVRGNLY